MLDLEERRARHRERQRRYGLRHPERVIATRRRTPMLAELKRRAKNKKYACTITLEELRSLRTLPCHYCGDRLPLFGPGADRRDNAVGYTKENCVPCCTLCNGLKREFLTEDEMIAVVDLLRQMRKREQIWRR